ncbi:MAG: copper ion binding protein, partial [Microvirga sp.]
MAAPKLSSELQSIDIPVEGMSCASCVGRVEKAIRSVGGVTAANVNLATERAHVSFAPGEADPKAVAEAIRATGYEPAENQIDLTIEGMTCASCVARVEKALERVPGVLDANVNLATERASVRYLGGHDIVERMREAVDATGYEAREIGRDADRTDHER